MNQRLSELILSARDNAERGAVMFLVAITALIVMVAGAIAVDLSAVATRGQSLQNAADSAALAGVQAYRQSMGERTDALPEDEAAAVAAVTDLLAQNGITDITPGIDFPDDANDTEVKVTLYDDDAGFLLSGFTGGSAGTVERSATARFERCEDNCVKEVDIPPPFQPVNAEGDGDGYKAIPVDDRLYSINHQSGGGGDRGSQQMTCVLRGSRDLTNWTGDPEENTGTSLCWDDFAGNPIPGVSAYPAGNVPVKTPEMPHAAVSGSKIYWASSTSQGHFLFCFETETPAACSSPLRLNLNTAATNLSNRLIHRGGGTIEANGLIYTFTDDHMVHCVIPGDTMTFCGSAKPTSLGAIGFPDNLASEENHGSSIDRIFDGTDRIYSTIHIDTVPEDAIPPCTFLGETMTANPADGLVDGAIVTLRNANSDLYISMNSDHSGYIDGTDPEDTNAQWIIDQYSNHNNYRFRNVGALDAGRSRYMAIDNNNVGSELIYTTGGSGKRVFVLEPDLTTVAIRNYNFTDIYITEGEVNSLIEVVGGDYEILNGDWIIKPWQCEVPDAGATLFGGVAYEQGTYLNCHETGATGGACAGFTPSKIHNDWDSFSGRLFFYRNGAGDPVAVCSTGFTTNWSWTDMSDATEVHCVDMDGAEDLAAELAMAQFTTELASRNDGSAGWGTWGDPHYNSHTNRMFYPTHRAESTVLCWDFDTGPCSEGISRAGTSVNPVTGAQSATQDYGYFSEGNCVYALGHNAIFWAFRADDIGEKCNGSGKTTPITPCNCGGSNYWGTLSFDVTEEQFDVFTIVINDDDGNQMYPIAGGPHSLLTDGDTIDLNFIPANDPNQRLWVTVAVVAKENVNPWADGEGSQTFTINIERTPV